MSVDIGKILSIGFKRTFKRNGLVLVGLTFLSALLTNTTGQSLFSNLSSSIAGSSTGAFMSQAYPLAINMPMPAAGVLYAASAIISAVISIGAIRTLVSDEKKRLPKSNFTENVLMPLLNLFVGGLIFALIMITAFALPVLPGYAVVLAGLGKIAGFVLIGIGTLISLALTFYLLTALFYWSVFVVVDDQNFIQGFKSSWRTTEGKRLKLFVAGLLVMFISFIAGFIFGIPAMIVNWITGMTFIGAVINMFSSAFMGVFSLAAIAEAYRQITG